MASLSVDWNDLGAGFALYLVIEGALPFAAPRRLKAAFARLIALPDQSLRLVGLSCMIAGCVLLYLIRS